MHSLRQTGSCALPAPLHALVSSILQPLSILDYGIIPSRSFPISFSWPQLCCINFLCFYFENSPADTTLENGPNERGFSPPNSTESVLSALIVNVSVRPTGPLLFVGTIVMTVSVTSTSIQSNLDLYSPSFVIGFCPVLEIVNLLSVILSCVPSSAAQSPRKASGKEIAHVVSQRVLQDTAAITRKTRITDKTMDLGLMRISSPPF